MTAPADEWLTAAVHESAHCAAYFRFNWKFSSVCIYEADGEVCGSVDIPPGRYNPTARAIACLSGPLAEARLTGVAFAELARNASCCTDVEMARTALARAGSFDLDRLMPFAYAAVSRDWPRITLIAAALFKRRQLDYEEVRRLIG
jgi:hypothetical protein